MTAQGHCQPPYPSQPACLSQSACLRVVIDGVEAGERAAHIATRLAVSLDLISVPDGAAHWGTAGFAAVIKQLQDRHPQLVIRATLDCGGAAGYAMAALNEAPGALTALIFTGPPAATQALAVLAQGRGVTLLGHRPPALWLRPGGDAAAAATAWLADNR